MEPAPYFSCVQSVKTHHHTLQTSSVEMPRESLYRYLGKPQKRAVWENWCERVPSAPRFRALANALQSSFSRQKQGELINTHHLTPTKMSTQLYGAREKLDRSPPLVLLHFCMKCRCTSLKSKERPTRRARTDARAECLGGLGACSLHHLHPCPITCTSLAQLEASKEVSGKIHLYQGTSEKGTSLLDTPAGKCSSEPLCLQLWDRHLPRVAAALPAAWGREEVPVNALNTMLGT